MTEEATIKKIVEITIKELKRKSIIKDMTDVIYNEISERIEKHYVDGEQDIKLKEALEELKKDCYIDVIEMYYKERLTSESIAEKLHVNASTIKRNKKRLCLEIYELLE